MKYVISENGALRKKASIVPKHIAIFTESSVHSDMVPPGHVALSAGFVMIQPTKKPGGIYAVCSGGSESLGLKATPMRDSVLLTTWLNYGESMMVMASESYDNEEEPV